MSYQRFLLVPLAPPALLLALTRRAHLFGATIGYRTVRDASEIQRPALLTFAAGVLLTLVVEELVPEAQEVLGEREDRLAPLVFVGGFTLFALLSAYLKLG